MKHVEVLQLADFPPNLQAMVDARFSVWRAHDVRGHRERQGQIRAILTRSNAAFDPEWLACLPALGLIATNGVGYDLIPVGEARARGVAVTHTPEVLNDAVAEYGVGLILAMLREIPQGDRYVRDGGWSAGSFRLGTQLAGKRVGILGMGRIGREVAQRLQAFKVDLAYCGRTDQGLDWRFEPDVVALAAWSDMLVLCLPGGEGTRQIVDAQVLDALGAQAYVVNLARGSVLDEDALLARLADGRLAGAALDVFEREPAIDARFAALGNVILSPHAASATVETRVAMMQLVLDNVSAFLGGQTLLTPVP